MTGHDLPGGGRAARMTLVLLLIGRLFLGFAYSALNPLGEAPDEADHYAYAAYIGMKGRLPEGPAMTQTKHPPLYHLLAAGFATAAGAEMDFGFLRSNPDGGVGLDATAPNLFIHTRLEAWPWRDGPLAMHLGRLISVFAGVVLVAATYVLGRAIWPRWYGGPLAAAAFVAFLPESLFIGGAMNNDILAAMWCTLALWLGLRATRFGHAILAGITMGLAFLTKVSTVGLWPVVCVVILINRPSTIGQREPTAGAAGEHSLDRRAGRAALAGLVASLIAVPWLWRNWRLYGDFLGWPVVLATIDRRQGPLTLSDLIVLGRGWFVSFWGKTGAAGQLPLPLPFYVLWVVLVLAALIGWVLVWRHNELRDYTRELRVTPAGWVILLGAPVMSILSILLYSRVALGTDQGRLLFPAIAPVALLLVRGIAGWLSPRGYRWLPIGAATGMALVGVLGLVTGVIQPFGPPIPPQQAEVASATQSGEQFADQLELLGFRWAEGQASDTGGEAISGGEVVPLTLYWRALRPLADDLRSTLRLTDAADNLVWEWKRSPGAGRYSTDHWPAQQLVRDVYFIPSNALAQAARVQLGVRPFPEGDWLSPASHPTTDPFVVIAKSEP